MADALAGARVNHGLRRCAACHTIRGGDLANVAERRVGPDLLNVTRQRERAWLERWMMQPDQMIASKDPVALRCSRSTRTS